MNPVVICRHCFAQYLYPVQYSMEFKLTKRCDISQNLYPNTPSRYPTSPRALVVDDVEVSSHKLVLQVCSIWDLDLVALVGDDDTSTSKTNALAE
jgi:hypothetical protein